MSHKQIRRAESGQYIVYVDYSSSSAPSGTMEGSAVLSPESAAALYRPVKMVPDPSSVELVMVDPALAREFAAWEAASDEALVAFEHNLD